MRRMLYLPVTAFQVSTSPTLRRAGGVRPLSRVHEREGGHG